MKYDDNHIIELLGIESLDEESKSQIVESVQSTMNMRLALRVTSELNDEQLEQFNSISESNPEGVQEWLTQNIQGFDSVIDEVAQEVIQEIKNSIQ